eukprot:1161128-Pelagomonas_calceolata.AAC.4
MQAVKTLPTSIKEKRMPRAEAPCIFFTKSNKRKKSMRIRWVTSSSPCLILLIRVEISLLKIVPGASKFVSILDRMSVKLPSKLGGLPWGCIWALDLSSMLDHLPKNVSIQPVQGATYCEHTIDAPTKRSLLQLAASPAQPEERWCSHYRECHTQ